MNAVPSLNVRFPASFQVVAPVSLIVPPTILLAAPLMASTPVLFSVPAIVPVVQFTDPAVLSMARPDAVTSPWMFNAAPAPKISLPVPASVPAVHVITPVTVRSPPPVSVPPSSTRLDADIAAFTLIVPDGTRRRPGPVTAEPAAIVAPRPAQRPQPGGPPSRCC